MGGRGERETGRALSLSRRVEISQFFLQLRFHSSANGISRTRGVES